ncbi:tRNA pseudouridine(55) synthase TruB [Pseudooceanicola sp. CBS1P-1]|uniref:tRNA pseudouridine synthase B n=1 Tax=Pseudooceanicola albus TaxID=2692189 RepID=A0A6L7G740_9RHOB|nr:MULTISPECIES: tRNA pseudouridine(55) synthase TruB [Pseudooceanicola]MBT9384142.1 tRNA pseudouridine(55) synthase TruB [Pseudooceanicola endophyticus]MXN19759.1 tRNA pseudouridine(55) synthase TruB [Pseudooceanicola albus]
MGRRRKGRDISGWIVVDKPAGLTSNAVVNKVRWAFDANKAGHAGTLDPEATGVLAVALGEATKTVPYITDALKAYVFTVRLGQATNTDDAEGEVIAQSDARPEDAAIKEALHGFVGDIMQVPPKFSAVKIDGERAYKLARDDEEFEIAARPLFVESLILLERPDADHITLEMVCGKGGYVRSIARDLGEKLGCFGHVRNLRRVWSGPFEADKGVSLATIEELARTPELDQHLLPLELGLTDLPHVAATSEGAAKMRHGNPGMVIASGVDYGEDCWASHNGVPVAVGQFRAGALHPSRVFNLSEEQ